MSEEPKPGSNTPSEASQTVDPQSVEGIFLEALAKERGPKRSEFLDAACSGSSELRTRVEALLRAYDDAGSFLQQPAGDWRNPPVTAAAGSSAEIDARGIPAGLLKASDDPNALGMIGPYEVRELIGRGGMGIVFRAFDAKLNRVVAIKVLAPELAAQPTARRRFLREAQAAAAVAHPHVVTIHAVDEDDWPYLVMECIEGQSLEEKIERSGTLKLAEVLRIGTQMAEGLAAAHKQGLVHRDVKPANILLENGVERVKITDFGLARAADDVTITRPGEISGTPQYMSPEQASGQRVDQRTDLFSLGCVLYAMCAGQPPFRADSMAAIVKKICTDQPQPLREIDPQIPDWLAAVIDRLLAKDPNERIQSAEEVAKLLGDALARVQAGYPMPVQTALARERTRPNFSLRALLVATALTAMLVAIGLYLVPEADRHNPAIAWSGPVFLAGAILAAILGCVAVARAAVVISEAISEFRRGATRWLRPCGVVTAVGEPERRPPVPPWPGTQGAPPFAAWVGCLCVEVAAGYWFGRLAWFWRLFAKMGHSEQLVVAYVVAMAFVPIWHRELRTASFPLTAAFAFVGLVVFLASSAVGHGVFELQGEWFGTPDWLIALATLLIGFLLVFQRWQRRSRQPATSVPNVAIPQGAGWTPRPWNVLGWLLVASLSFAMAATIAVAVGLLLPAYQRAQARRTVAMPQGHTIEVSTAPKIHTITPGDELLSPGAKWVGNELDVTADAAGSVRLFELPLNGVDQSAITYRFNLLTNIPGASVYPEMLCRVPAFGEAFSRDPTQITGGISSWVTLEIPFTLRKDQFADLLKLNLVFATPGTVRMKNIEVVVTPLADQRPMGPGGGAGPSVLPSAPAGRPKVVRAMQASDPPISAHAKWVGDELEVTATEAGPVRLFEVPLDRIDQSIITYRFRIKADDLASSVYPEMWTRVAGFGEFFSRGLDQKIKGTIDWTSVEIPAFLQKDQFADSVKLNIVFEGPGKVRVKDIEVLATAMP